MSPIERGTQIFIHVPLYFMQLTGEETPPLDKLPLGEKNLQHFGRGLHRALSQHLRRKAPQGMRYDYEWVIRDAANLGHRLPA